MAGSDTISRSPLASAVKALREKRGLTQQQFADALGVTLSAVAKYETTYKPNRAMLRVFQNMSEDYGMPELVPIFVQAATKPMSDDSTQFSGRARLDAAEKYVIDATRLLVTVRNALIHEHTGPHFRRDYAQRLRALSESVDNLVFTLSQLASEPVVDPRSVTKSTRS